MESLYLQALNDAEIDLNTYSKVSHHHCSLATCCCYRICCMLDTELEGCSLFRIPSTANEEQKVKS